MIQIISFIVQIRLKSTMIESALVQQTIKTEFELDPGFVNSYRYVKPPFGFNGLGEVVYMRTYSRTIGDTDMKEKWFQTVERVRHTC